MTSNSLLAYRVKSRGPRQAPNKSSRKLHLQIQHAVNGYPGMKRTIYVLDMCTFEEAR